MTPLSSDPAKARQWQQRSQQRALAKLRERGAKLAPRERAVTVKATDLQAAKQARKPAKRHNDGPWRAACVEAYGEVCRNCGDTTHVEMDHVIPKSQDRTARADVENGLPLCGAFSRSSPFPEGCHPAKTAGRLRFNPDWFSQGQLEYLAAKGYVDFDDDGNPFGRGYKHFEARKARASGMEGGQHG